MKSPKMNDLQRFFAKLALGLVEPWIFDPVLDGDSQGNNLGISRFSDFFLDLDL